jgi:CheY-like chemotaxis protein
MKVPVVDDIETNRKLLRVNLEGEGIEICEAEDGIEAFVALQHEKVDAIISDILRVVPTLAQSRRVRGHRRRLGQCTTHYSSARGPGLG